MTENLFILYDYHKVCFSCDTDERAVLTTKQFIQDIPEEFFTTNVYYKFTQLKQ